MSSHLFNSLHVTDIISIHLYYVHIFAVYANIWMSKTPFDRASLADFRTIEYFRYFRAMTWFTLYAVGPTRSVTSVFSVFGNIGRRTLGDYNSITLSRSTIRRSFILNMECIYHCFFCAFCIVSGEVDCRPVVMWKRRADYFGNPLQGSPPSSSILFSSAID
jgi:hypothetical protein